MDYRTTAANFMIYIFKTICLPSTHEPSFSNKLSPTPYHPCLINFLPSHLLIPTILNNLLLSVPFLLTRLCEDGAFSSFIYFFIAALFPAIRTQ